MTASDRPAWLGGHAAALVLSVPLVAEACVLAIGQRYGARPMAMSHQRYEVNRGAVVISPTPAAIDALYTARERLETAAVVREPKAELVAAIDAAFDQLRAAAGTRDARLIVEKDLALHAALVALLECSRVDAFYADLTRELRFYLMVLSVEDSEADDPDGVIAEHEPIVSAIRAGDRERAVAEVRAHVETNAERLRQILSARG